MSKPVDLMLGILDFFAVMLPGAVATWLVSQYLPEDLRSAFRLSSGEHTSIAPWFVFLLTSYALGHFVFMSGSKLDGLYDLWRKRTKPTKADVPFKAAEKLRQKVTPALAGDGFSTFKWARAFVGIHSPQARVEIDRLEASSKFFRGMVVISILLIAHFLAGRRELLAATLVAIGGLSFWRFCDQRWKMTELTYATAVIVHQSKTKPGRADEKEEDDD